MNNARDRAEALRNYRHYRALLTSKRLDNGQRDKVAGMADALADRWNLTNVRLAR